MSQSLSLSALRRGAALCAAIILCLSCAQKPAGKEGGGASTAGEQELSTQTPEKVVFWIDDFAVTEEELRRFSEANMGEIQSLHGGHWGGKEDNPFQMVKPYLRYYALVKLGQSRGMEDKKEQGWTLDMAEARATVPFYKRHLADTAAILPGDIQTKLPEKWVKINFMLFPFNSIEEGNEAFNKASAGKDPVAVLMEHSSSFARKDLPETGSIFPASGFFDYVDDDYLFDLKEGQVSRPVHSGIGLVVAYVKSRQDFTRDEIDQYLSDLRSKLTVSTAAAEERRLVRDYGYTIDVDRFLPAAVADMERGEWSKEVVGTVGDHEITYEQFRWSVTSRLAFYKKAYEPEKVPQYLLNDFERFLQEVALGLASEKDDDFSPPLDAVTRKRTARWDLIYRLMQWTLWNEIPSGVSQEEIRIHYDQNAEKFQQPERVKFLSYFTPRKEDVELMWKAYRHGADFSSLEGSAKGGSAPHEGGLQAKVRLISRGGTDLAPLQDVLFTMAVGEAKVIAVDTGYYLVKILEKQSEKKLSFEEVKQSVWADLDRKRRREAIDRYLTEVESAYNVRFVNEREPQEMPDLPFQERG